MFNIVMLFKNEYYIFTFNISLFRIDKFCVGVNSQS